MSTSYALRCRRCQMPLTDDVRDCPHCGTGPLKALIQLGTMPNGHQVNLYLDQYENGPQIAVLRAILEKYQQQADQLREVREVLGRHPTNLLAGRLRRILKAT